MITQYEKYSKLAEEQGVYKKRLSDLGKVLEETEKSLQKERSDKASIEHSQDELLKKMKDLQKENDHLVTKLEGLKTENEGLINKNKKLEDRIKTLEIENKEQLKQVNETLNLPAPSRSETPKEVSFGKTEEIVKKEYSTTAPSAYEAPKSNASTLVSPTSSILTNRSPALSGEMRSLSLEKKKEVAIITEIIESSMTSKASSMTSKASSIASTKISQDPFASNSQGAPTVHNDSVFPSTSATFAETFSRSGENFKIRIYLSNYLQTLSHSVKRSAKHR